MAGAPLSYIIEKHGYGKLTDTNTQAVQSEYFVSLCKCFVVVYLRAILEVKINIMVYVGLFAASIFFFFSRKTKVIIRQAGMVVFLKKRLHCIPD